MFTCIKKTNLIFYLASFYGVEIPSILLQILINARIKFDKKSSEPDSRIKTYLLTYIDQNSLVSLALNMLIFLTFIILIGISFAASLLPLETLVSFPYSLLFFYTAVILPCFLCFLFIGGTLFNNPQMRKCIWREVQNVFLTMAEKLHKSKKF